MLEKNVYSVVLGRNILYISVKSIYSSVAFKAPVSLVIFWLEDASLGQPGWLSGLAPPLAQGLILETPDQVPRQAPHVEPASPSACVSAFCLSLSLSMS